MKAAGNHEGPIEQMDRLYRDRLCNRNDIPTDEDGRIRLDDWEMLPDIQQKVAGTWVRINARNLNELADFQGYQEEVSTLVWFSGLKESIISTEVDIETSLPQ